MLSITIELTAQQEKFLKMFAGNHYPGAIDNLATDIPIHVVQSKTVDYIPADEDYAEEELENVVFSSTMFSNNEKFKTPCELVKTYYKDEKCPVEILEYEEAKNKEITGIDGEKYYIHSFTRYFKTYGIEGYGIDYVYESWRDVAFFFILKEAKQYITQQAHNLNEPRTFSYSPGYANEGEYRHFYELLRGIGSKLLERESLTESTGEKL